jgi:hypothetical protein
MIQLGVAVLVVSLQARQMVSLPCVIFHSLGFLPIWPGLLKSFSRMSFQIFPIFESRCARWSFPPESPSSERASFKRELKTMSSSAPGPWIKLYKSRRWERRSRRNLQAHKFLCQECLKAGKTEPATLSHHLNEFQPNFTEWEFWFGELTALCHHCHFKIHHPGYDIKDRGFLLDIGSDGYPIDPRHDVYNSTTAKRESPNE